MAAKVQPTNTYFAQGGKMKATTHCLPMRKLSF